MSTLTKKRKSKHSSRQLSRKLPHNVTKQLERIYFNSAKKIKKQPYKISGGILLSLGMVSGIYFLIRHYMK